MLYISSNTPKIGTFYRFLDYIEFLKISLSLNKENVNKCPFFGNFVKNVPEKYEIVLLYISMSPEKIAD